MTELGSRPIAPHRGDRVCIGEADPQLIVAVADGRLTLQDDEGMTIAVKAADTCWDPLYRTWRLERSVITGPGQ